MRVAQTFALLAGLVVSGFAGCGGRVQHGPATPVDGDEVTLYRDRALIRQRVEIEVPASGTTTLTVQVAAGTTVQDVVVIDRGELTIGQVRGSAPPPAPGEVSDRVTDAETADEDAELADEGHDVFDQVFDDEASDEDASDEPAEVAPAALPAAPAELTFVVSASRPGRHALALAYVTDRLRWDAAYTLTTTPARSHATLRGALAIHNQTGVVFVKARAYVVDAELGSWRGRIADQLGSALARTKGSTTPLATPRALGAITLGTGDTRVELLPRDAPRRMRSVLVYDPIGTKLDHAGAAPIRDLTLGTEPPSSHVTESFEIARTAGTSDGLPGGPVRLLERRTDGTMSVLGEARLFDASTRVAEDDTVAVGVAEGITGHRERREITIDDDRKRLVEEFVLTLRNKRARPADIVLREHLYRGQNWTLAYQTASDPRKEGPQQISLRATVPANGETKVLYVVVYTWP